MCYSHIRLHFLSYRLEEVVVMVEEEVVVVVVEVVEEEEEVVVVVMMVEEEEVVVVVVVEAVAVVSAPCKCWIHSYWSCKHYCCKGSHNKDCNFLCFIPII